MSSNLAIFNQTIRAERTQNYLNDVLREKKDSFVTSLVSVVTNNTTLQACNPQTIMYAALKATSLSLPIDPSLGFAYVIPYKNKGVDEAQFQMGAKGYIQLAMRTGQFQCINTDAVYEGEISKIDRKSGDIFLDGERKSDKVVGYFAYFKLTNGFEKILYMTKEEIQAHAKRFSRAYTSSASPWTSDFDAMAKKTILKALLSKYAPMSIELQSAVKADQAIYRNEQMVEEYADNATQDADEQMNAQVQALKDKAQSIRARARQSAEKPAQAEQNEQEIPAPTAEDLPADDAEQAPVDVFQSMPTNTEF